MTEEDKGTDADKATEILIQWDNSRGFDVTETSSGLAVIDRAPDYIAELETRTDTPYL